EFTFHLSSFTGNVYFSSCGNETMPTSVTLPAPDSAAHPLQSRLPRRCRTGPESMQAWPPVRRRWRACREPDEAGKRDGQVAGMLDTDRISPRYLVGAAFWNSAPSSAVSGSCDLRRYLMTPEPNAAQSEMLQQRDPPTNVAGLSPVAAVPD